jgi:aspartyl protease
MRPRGPLVLSLVALAAGCALYSDVSISQLVVTPANIDHGGDLPSMLRKYDYLNAVMSASRIEARSQQRASDLAALGSAEFISGRFDAARKHLREALDLQPFRTTYAEIAWDLSQLEYLSNNFDASLDWAKLASEHGTQVKQWHMDYLAALKDVDVYRFSGRTTERVTMKFGRPDVPRINVMVNGKQNAVAMIDSGAVLSIISSSVAAALPVRRLGDFEGTFSGLLGEPIPVHFGMLDSVDIGGMHIANVPVAIMPDDKMQFFVTGKKPFKMDLLLGAHLLKEFRIELDFQRGLMRLQRLTPAMHKPVANQNMFYEHFRPAVRGMVNRHGWYLFLLDTGSEITFLNLRELSSLPASISSPTIHNAVLQGLGGAEKHGSKLEDVEIGIDRWAGAFRTLPMYESAAYEHTTGILGENYLKNFDVVIDFGRMRMDLAPVGMISLDDEPLVPARDASGRVTP